MAARGEFSAVILLLDPSDPWSDSVEYRALKRVCIQLESFLITTYMAAQRWLTLEAPLEPALAGGQRRSSRVWKPTNWKKGVKNVTKEGDYKKLPIRQRTVALISHDKKKIDMVKFVKDAIGALAEHQRVLTTGTTGWVLKLLFASKSKEAKLFKSIRASRSGEKLERRVADVLKSMLKALRDESEAAELLAQLRDQLNGSRDLGKLLKELKVEFGIKNNDLFVDTIMPLPSGPLGGDVLIAESILDNECHSIVFFHDPSTSHPHSADIRLLERTSQQPGTFAECVSDPTSARRWLRGIGIELKSDDDSVADLARRFRQRFNLHEVIIVEVLPGKVSSSKRAKEPDKDGPELGTALVRACAGYFHQRLLDKVRQKKKEIRVAVSWGWACYHILETLKDMRRVGLLEEHNELFESVVWLPIIGTITAEITSEEANVIAEGLSNFYGGRVDGVPFAGFVRSGNRVPKRVSSVLRGLEDADIVLTAASPWNEEASLAKHTGLDPRYFPGFERAVGLVSGVFLDENGEDVKENYSAIGLGYNGFQQAAKRRAVIMVCGGVDRRPILSAALKAGMVSSLITTRHTAEDLLNEAEG